MDQRPEADLRRLYAEVLGVDDPPAHESFFALGGSSMTVMLLVELVEEQLGITLPVEEFYEEPTLAGLTAAVLGRRGTPGHDDLAGLVAAAAAADPDRPAVVAPDGSVGYGALADLLEHAAAASDEEPMTLRLESSLAGARDVLCHLAARRRLLVLDPAATTWEEQRARSAFDGHLATRPDLSVLAFTTSGSTGRPKVVVLPHEGYIRAQWVEAGLYDLGHGDGYLVTAPLHYAYGLTSGLLAGLATGATVVLPDRPLSPQSLGRCLHENRIDMTVGVSLAYRLLLASGAPLNLLRQALVGGDPLPDGLVRAWQEATAAPLLDSYGTTETGKIAVNTDATPGSVGRPLPDAEVRIRHPDGAVGTSGAGELLVRRPGMALGYAGDPEATAERFVDGWFATRDLVDLREDGRLFLRGRIDDLINLGGTKVDPWEVEEACREALGLEDCAVGAASLPMGGTELRLYVVGPAPTRPQVTQALTGRLSAHKIPTRVVPVPALPRTDSGKLLRRELADGR